MKHFVAESYFEVVADVNDTWQQIKSTPDYKTDFGATLFRRYVFFFQMCSNMRKRGSVCNLSAEKLTCCSSSTLS